MAHSPAASSHSSATGLFAVMPPAETITVKAFITTLDAFDRSNKEKVLPYVRQAVNEAHEPSMAISVAAALRAFSRQFFFSEYREEFLSLANELDATAMPLLLNGVMGDSQVETRMISAAAELITGKVYEVYAYEDSSSLKGGHNSLVPTEERWSPDAFKGVLSARIANLFQSREPKWNQRAAFSSGSSPLEQVVLQTIRDAGFDRLTGEFNISSIVLSPIGAVMYAELPQRGGPTRLTRYDYSECPEFDVLDAVYDPQLKRSCVQKPDSAQAKNLRITQTMQVLEANDSRVPEYCREDHPAEERFIIYPFVDVRPPSLREKTTNPADGQPLPLPALSCSHLLGEMVEGEFDLYRFPTEEFYQLTRPAFWEGSYAPIIEGYVLFRGQLYSPAEFESLIEEGFVEVL